MTRQATNKVAGLGGGRANIRAPGSASSTTRCAATKQAAAPEVLVAMASPVGGRVVQIEPGAQRARLDHELADERARTCSDEFGLIGPCPACGHAVWRR